MLSGWSCNKYFSPEFVYYAVLIFSRGHLVIAVCRADEFLECLFQKSHNESMGDFILHTLCDLLLHLKQVFVA